MGLKGPIIGGIPGPMGVGILLSDSADEGVSYFRGKIKNFNIAKIPSKLLFWRNFIKSFILGCLNFISSYIVGPFPTLVRIGSIERRLILINSLSKAPELKAIKFTRTFDRPAI